MKSKRMMKKLYKKQVRKANELYEGIGFTIVEPCIKKASSSMYLKEINRIESDINYVLWRLRQEIRQTIMSINEDRVSNNVEDKDNV